MNLEDGSGVAPLVEQRTPPRALTDREHTLIGAIAQLREKDARRERLVNELWNLRHPTPLSAVRPRGRRRSRGRTGVAAWISWERR